MHDPLPFQKIQLQFTGHLRKPESVGAPSGTRPEAMKVYRELLLGNVEGFLSRCFPVAQSILGEDKWWTLVRAFFADHACASPLFRHIPEEFLAYLQRSQATDLPDFLLQLLHYEWIELALSISSQVLEVQVDPGGDLMAGRPALNPVFACLRYDYPVHRISPDFIPAPNETEETHLLVFRDPVEETQFMVLNAASARLVNILQQASITGEAAARRIAEEMGAADPMLFLTGARQLLQDLRRRGAILGTLPSTVAAS